MPSWIRPPGRGQPNESTNETNPWTGQIEMAPEPLGGNGPPPPAGGNPICACWSSVWYCW